MPIMDESLKLDNSVEILLMMYTCKRKVHELSQAIGCSIEQQPHY